MPHTKQHDMQNEPEQSKTEVSKQKKPRRLNGLLVFGIIALVLVVINYRPPIPTIACTDEIIASRPDAIMLGAWWCTYCYKARKYFNNNKISYCEYDIEHTKKGEQMYQKLNGRGIPLLLIGKHQINGFDEYSIERALSELHGS